MSANPQGPIGVFDSGVGGVSVLHHIVAELPGEDVVYFADSYHAPYGEKSADEIRARSTAVSRYLLRLGAKALVAACNTATAAAVADLRSTWPDLPVIGMEPAIKPAVAATKSGVIGVLATVGTLKSAKFAALLDNYAGEAQVITQGCPGLVELIEGSALDTPEACELVNHYLQPLLQAGADTIVLGCTHYPFLRPLIAELAGPSITLIDTGAAVARQVRRQLEEHSLLNERQAGGQVEFTTNSCASGADAVIERLWGQPATVRCMKPGHPL